MTTQQENVQEDQKEDPLETKAKRWGQGLAYATALVLLMLWIVPIFLGKP